MLKVLLLDIETAPKVTYTWGVWKQNHPAGQLISDEYILTWSAKWLGDDEVYGERVSRDEAMTGYDGRILERLWHMMDEADVVMGHNSIKFDVPIINSRFLLNGYTPPSPYRNIDTLRMAKQKFRFTYNRLDYLGEVLGVGRKIDTGGFELWKRCLSGEKAALEEMLDYNKQDVVLLEKVYYKLMPYVSNLPNQGMNGPEHQCPKCGGSHVVKRGYAYTNASRFQRYRCNDCGSWSRGRQDTRGKEEKKNTLAPITQ